MNYVKINGILYPAEIMGKRQDRDWNARESKAINLEMDYATAMATFVDGLAWYIVTVTPVTKLRKDENGEPVLGEEGNPVYHSEDLVEEFDNTDYCVAGPVTDNRDGTVTVKMGKKTDSEMLAELWEVLGND